MRIAADEMIAAPRIASSVADSKKLVFLLGHAISHRPAAHHFDFVERLPCVPEGVDSRWDAAVNADLKQDLLDLVLGDAVLQGSFDVKLQFVGTPLARRASRD